MGTNSDWVVNSEAPATFAVVGHPVPSPNTSGWVVDSETPGPGPVNTSLSARAQTAENKFNAGGLDILGIPANTGVNLWNLAKAGIGYSYSKFKGGAVPPDWTMPTDPTNVPGTGEWLKHQANQVGIPTTAVDPRDPLQRYGGNVMEAAPSLALGGANSTGQLIRQGIGTVTGAVGQQAAADAGASPLTQMLVGAGAGAAPGLAEGAAVAGARGALGVTNKGAAARQQALATAQQAGVDNPTVGQIAPGAARVVESTAKKIPGGMGVLAARFSQQAKAVQDNIDGMVDAMAPQGATPAAGGRAIEQGVQSGGFIQKYKQTKQQLFNAADALIPGNTTVDSAPLESILKDLTSPTDESPLTAKVRQNYTNSGYFQDIADGLDKTLRLRNLPAGSQPHSLPATPAVDGWRGQQGDFIDAGQVPPGANLSGGGYTRVKQPAVDAQDGYLVPGENVGDTPKFLATKDLPRGTDLNYSDVKALRTQVGAMLDSPQLSTDIPRGNLKRVYGTLSGMMNQAAEDAGPQAQAAVSRANNYFQAGQARMDLLDRVLQRGGGPEQIYNAALSNTKDGASTLHAVMQALPSDQQRVVTATFMDRLGKQTADGPWSLSTFLTQMSKLSKPAKAELFGRIDPEYQRNLQAMSHFAQNQKGYLSVLDNPSGTGAASNAIRLGTTAGGAVTALMFGHHTAGAVGLAGVGGTVGGAWSAARLMSNPNFVKWMANSYRYPKSATPALMVQLQQMSRNGDDTPQNDVANFTQALSQMKNQITGGGP